MWNIKGSLDKLLVMQVALGVVQLALLIVLFFLLRAH